MVERRPRGKHLNEASYSPCGLLRRPPDCPHRWKGGSREGRGWAFTGMLTIGVRNTREDRPSCHTNCIEARKQRRGDGPQQPTGQWRCPHPDSWWGRDTQVLPPQTGPDQVPEWRNHLCTATCSSFRTDKNSLFLRLIPLFAMTCWRTYSGVGIFGFSESSIPAHQPSPLLCPVCPQLQESQRQCLFQEENLTTTLCSTSPQHLWATESSTGGQSGSLIFPHLIDITYKVLLMPRNGRR